MENISAENSSDIPLRPRPVVVLLLDGWGVAPFSEANALAKAKLPNLKRIIKDYPVATLRTGEKSLNARYLSLGAGTEINDDNATPALTLSGFLAAHDLRQLKVTETERLAALTYFFNGRKETAAPGETWNIVSSEAGDHKVKPSLALKRIVKALVQELDKDEADLVVSVWPTLSLTAASGDFAAVTKAAQAIDKNIKKIMNIVLAKQGILIISSPCGNAEQMRNLTTELADTDMTANAVPLIVIGEEFKNQNLGWSDPINEDLSLLEPIGSLADFAPTIIDFLHLDQPAEMSGHSLVDRRRD